MVLLNKQDRTIDIDQICAIITPNCVSKVGQTAPRAVCESHFDL